MPVESRAHETTSRHHEAQANKKEVSGTKHALVDYWQGGCGGGGWAQTDAILHLAIWGTQCYTFYQRVLGKLLADSNTLFLCF